MSAYGRYHEAVKNALVKDGWTITHDPLTLRLGKRDLFVDLGAEQVIGAEKEAQRIAVEVKTFLGTSAVTDLHEVLGQFVLYQDVLAELEPHRASFRRRSGRWWCAARVCGC